MVVVLSLIGAVSYGLADFVGGFGSRRTSPWAVALLSQVGGGLVLLVVAAALGGDPVTADWWWAIAAGVANGLGTAALYRGLARGRMGVVAPVSGVGAATLPVLVAVLLGERPPAVVWAGILIALPGIWLVAREPATGPVSGPSGLVDGVLAGLGFGGLFVCLAQIPEEAGFLPLAVNQLFAGVVIVLIALTLRSPWVPREAAALFGIGAGLLAGLATGAFLLATQTGFLSVAAVITSLYPAVTVLLAALVLREHIHRGQAAGLALCALAVTLVAGG
jgi:drug/metabolite transporter (DMT)-like permease